MMVSALLIWGYVRSALGGLLTFCSKPPGSWIAAAIAACLGLWWFGHLRYAAGFAAAAALAAARAAKIKTKQDAAIVSVSARADERALDSAKKDAGTRDAINNVKKDAAAMAGAGDVAIDAAIADRLRSLQ